ncbi:MAG TPA: sensor histidine kinase, partial [Acidobacteriota bacterium]|nr:sensor histidine kinase [Acidobacteriota bacterium]
IEAGMRRTAYYSYLPAGEYTFQVKAANRDGVWALSVASVKVKVLPFFYQTWWFYSLVFSMISSVAFLLFRLRINQIEEKHREQEAFSRKLIDSQELERKRIAAELHDSLGQSLVIIKNRARLGLKPDDDLENKENQLDGISMAATQAIEELREISFNLRPYLLDKIGLTRTLKSMLGKVFPPGETRVIVEIDELDDVFSKDSEILFYRIIQESVNNIVKHAQATQAHISIKRVKQSVVVTIEDNGKGFDLTDTRLTTQQSFGLIGIAERARLLGGNHFIISEIGRGTTVTITIDLSQENL